MLASKLVIEAQDARVRLIELGLPLELLVEAVERGQIVRNDCTENDPPTFPGMFAWSRTVRTLREMLIPLGWHRNNSQNLAKVLSPDGTLAIVVATGDEATGLISSTPKTKYPRGPVTVAAVESNAAQLELGLPQSASEKAASKQRSALAAGGRIMWLLLVAVKDGVIRHELSLPDFVGPDDRVESWKERIILPEVPFNLSNEDNPEGNDLGPEIVVEVSKKK